MSVAEREPVRVGSEAVVDSLAAVGRAIVAVTARALAGLDVDVTLSQYRTLVILATHAPLRTVDLAAALQVHPSTATRACNRLVGRGLVARHQRELDRRVSWLCLTEAGKELVGTVMRRRKDEIRQLVRASGVTGREPAVAVLRALVAASGEPTEEQWWRRWNEAASTDHIR